MPRGAGVFIRTNGEFNGAEVWQDDLEKPEKIVALRHDTHDEDIANGIAECLPKDGSEPMLGTLEMGGFGVRNVLQATLSNAMPSFGQTITAVSWDAILEQLTLTRVDMVDLVVTIPLDGGGGGTPITGMQRQVAGSGIQFVNGNEMSTGNPDDTISLTNSGVASGSYVNPNMTVDIKGRITSITSGSPTGTDLSNDPNTVSVIVNSSTGFSTNILQATPSGLAGVMTALQAQQLADLVASGGAGMKPPLGIYGIEEEGIIDLLNAVQWIAQTSENSGDSLGEWVSLRSESGSGVVDFLGLRLVNIGIDNVTIGIRLLVDGNVVWQDSSFYPNMVEANDPQNSDVIFIGSQILNAGAGASQMAFNESWDIQTIANSNASNSFLVYAKYQSDQPFVE